MKANAKMNTFPIIARAVVLAVVFCAAVLAPSYASDRTISTNYVLSADETVDGVLTVASGVTVDLNSYSLIVQGLAGEGTITSPSIVDLTSPDPNAERVSYTTGKGDLYGGTQAHNLFNNNYERVVDGTHRVLIQASNLPLAITYDFGADSPQTVDMYKVYSGPYGDNQYNQRSPKVWTFEGSNDNGNWTLLDSRNSEIDWAHGLETRTYTFENTTAYRYYRITFMEATSTAYLELVQLEYFDTSAAPTRLGELRVNVPANTSETNSTVTISGGIRFVKDGAGEFVAAKPNQLYLGGTEIVAGTLKAMPGIDQTFGPRGGDMTVGNGTTFDFHGSSSCSIYPFIVNGGTVANTESNLDHSVSMLADLTLTDDSVINLTAEGNIRGINNMTVSVNLNDHLLSITNHGSVFRLVNADISSGAIDIMGSDGTVIFNGVRAPLTSFELSGEFGAFVEHSTDVDVAVSNLTLRSDFRTTARNDARGIISTYGRFTTETTEFPFVKMMDGSTLDLSAQNGTFDTMSTSANVNHYCLTFAAGATVTVDVSGRTFAHGDCIVSWNEMPQGITILFDAETAAGGVAPIVTERGIFYGYVENAVEWAWWTNAANDGDLTNPANWRCKNANGGTVASALPSATTRVYLEGDALNIQIPKGNDLTCGVCVLTNCAFAVDCDLRGLGAKLQVGGNATINLNGHRLYVPASALTNACEVMGLGISHADDLTTNDASHVSSSSIFAINTKASNLFNNNYARGGTDKYRRVIMASVNLPLIVTYDFGETKVVDAYRIWTGPMESWSRRLPMIWKFEGSNDNANWALLDARHAETAWPDGNTHRTYTFDNTTAYRYYRMTVTAPQTNSDGYLEIVQFEYFHLKPTQSELHIETSSGDYFEYTGLTMSGNMRLFVEGPGSVRFMKTGQTYVGGTELCGGTVGAGIIGDVSLFHAALFGEEGCEVIVRGNGSGAANATSAVLGFAKKSGYTGYKYVLDGGTIQDSGSGIVTELRLYTNSYMKATSAIVSGDVAWVGSTGAVSIGYADLGGHELSVTVQSGRKFGLSNATLENGSLYVRSGGWFYVTNSVVATNNALIKVNCAPDIGGTFNVWNYTQLNTSENFNMGDSDIDVYGTYKPGNLGQFHGATLHDGSALDLSDLSAALNAVSPWNTASATAKGVRTLHFEAGATIGVILGERHISGDTPVITWTAAEKPDATVKFKSADTGELKPCFIVKEDGLYVVNPGFILMIL